MNSSSIDKICLERTGCYGDCPIYVVEVRADGRVRYEGKMFVAVEGRRERRVDRAAVAALFAKFVAAEFAGVMKRYEVGDDMVEMLVTDTAGAILTVVAEGRMYRCTHDHGRVGSAAVEVLSDLEAAVDAVAGTEAWVGAA